jgi:hypothetical protein
MSDRLIEEQFVYDRNKEFASATKCKITDSINRAIIKDIMEKYIKKKDSMFVTKRALAKFLIMILFTFTEKD